MIKIYTDLSLDQNGLKTTYLGAPYTSITYLLEYPFSTITQIKRSCRKLKPSLIKTNNFFHKLQNSERVTISFQQLAYINLVI